MSIRSAERLRDKPDLVVRALGTCKCCLLMAATVCLLLSGCASDGRAKNATGGMEAANEQTTAPQAPQSAAPAETPAVEIVEEHYPDGALLIRREVLRQPDGRLLNHGLFTEWHPDGTKKLEVTFIRGAKEGTETTWHLNGQVWIKQDFAAGQPHGPRRTWDEQGRLRGEEFFAHGLPHGTWTVWNDMGEVKMVQEWDRGEPEP